MTPPFRLFLARPVRGFHQLPRHSSNFKPQLQQIHFHSQFHFRRPSQHHDLFKTTNRTPIRMACNVPGVSQACCNVPPVTIEGYQPKGDYVKLHGLDTYVTGPENATKALLTIYDIFGFKSQTLQGADILGCRHKVIIPDFFEHEPAALEWYPPVTDDQKAKMTNFFSTKAVPDKTLNRIPAILKEAQEKYPSIQEWAILGYCWGGKISVLASGKFKEFKVGVQCHPAMLDPQDANNVSIPYLSLPSKDEDPEAVQAFKANLEKKNVPHKVERYENQIHGWMAARGDLHNKDVVSDYEKGYKTVLDFLCEHF